MNKDIKPDKESFIELSKMKMPFGKYKDRLLIDLPEPYLVWFSRQGFPKGKLGNMLQTVYEIEAKRSTICFLGFVLDTPKKA